MEGGISRQLAGYTPSVWGDYFIRNHAPSSSTTLKSEGWMREKVEELVIQVKNLLDNTYEDELQSLELIDSLQRLGVGYHFEGEIDKRLREIHDDSGKKEGNDLQAVALKFRLLRQHGYNVPSDVFSKYKDDERKFKSNLANNIRGLLSLYEACFLSTPEDDILDEALNFAKHHLQSLSDDEQLDLALKTLISHTLELPLHRRIPRLGARYYMRVYEQDKENRNDIVLELAKLDFNLLQLLHHEEVKSLSIWWEKIVHDGKFSFSRDRIVECYFWILSVYFEPQYSMARKITTKVIALLSITDDIYDVYGTSDELQSFTDVIMRWDEEATQQLKEYLKVHFHILTKTLQDFDNELISYGKSYRVQYFKKIFKVLIRAWNKEVKWRDEGYIPALKDHLEVTTVTTCYNLLSCASFIGMGDEATNEVFDWVLTFPKFTYQASLICRIRDDVVSQEFEHKRNHVASTVQCYMKEHNTTLDHACEELLKMVEHAWKSLNHEYLNLSGTFSRNVLMIVMNLARFMETTYDIQDKYTHSTFIKHHISMLLVEQISFEEWDP